MPKTTESATLTLTSGPMNLAEATPEQVHSTPTPEIQVCSPLAGYSKDELIVAISNPFHPPARPGSDDPHQAIDLAVEQYGMAVTGEAVHTILAGKVAGVIQDRFPYGNAVMIETILDGLPLEWEQQLQVPTPAPTFGPHPSLTCPQVDTPLTWKEDSRSLYLLYAHMLGPVSLALDDPVGCGETIGAIGQSGNALNPHIHLELRVGPSGVRFASMAHYSGGITPQEMHNYCTWRVSGVFQLMDPVRVLEWLP